MSNIAEEFEDWMRKKHLKECSQCRREGKARLIDGNLTTVRLFREFYESKLRH